MILVNEVEVHQAAGDTDATKETEEAPTERANPLHRWQRCCWWSTGAVQTHEARRACESCEHLAVYGVYGVFAKRWLPSYAPRQSSKFKAAFCGVEQKTAVRATQTPEIVFDDTKSRQLQTTDIVGTCNRLITCRQTASSGSSCPSSFPERAPWTRSRTWSVPGAIWTGAA